MSSSVHGAVIMKSQFVMLLLLGTSVGGCVSAHAFTLGLGECVGVRGSPLEVTLSLCMCVCLCVRGRKGVGARPGPDS